MDNDRKETLEEAAELIQDQNVVIDLLREDISDLQSENRSLKGQLALKQVDSTYAVGVYT